MGLPSRFDVDVSFIQVFEEAPDLLRDIPGSGGQKFSLRMTRARSDCSRCRRASGFERGGGRTDDLPGVLRRGISKMSEDKSLYRAMCLSLT